MQQRLTRRVAGVLHARLPEAQLEAVLDPRQRSDWPLPTLLRTTLVGLLTGAKSFAETEKLTAELSRPMAHSLHIPRRVPDTTLRDLAVRLDPNEIRKALHAQNQAAHRRKALAPLGLPFGVVAIDGKATALPDWDQARTQRPDWDDWNEGYGQQQSHAEGHGSSRIVRTLTCSLVSTRARPCLDAVPIPASTNEMGHFLPALEELTRAYGRLNLFRMISTDAGMCSEAHGRAVVRDYRLDYLFSLNDQQPTLFAEARRVLANRTAKQADAETTDVVGKYTVTRRAYLTDEMAGFLDWDHLQTVMRVESVKTEIETGCVTEQEDRYYLSSHKTAGLTADQWLYLVRCHWGVENNCHNTWDKIFREDDRPWIVSSPRGMVVILLLRRIAYNIVTLFRSVTQRSDERRLTPWKDILRWFYNLLIAGTVADLEGLRPRTQPPAVV